MSPTQIASASNNLEMCILGPVTTRGTAVAWVVYIAQGGQGSIARRAYCERISPFRGESPLRPAQARSETGAPSQLGSGLHAAEGGAVNACQTPVRGGIGPATQAVPGEQICKCICPRGGPELTAWI